MFKVICGILIICVDKLAFSYAAEIPWGYSNVAVEYRPENWKDLEGFETCGGTRQSPIHIYSKDLEEKDLGELTFKGYDTVPSAPIKVDNNGHTLDYAGDALSKMSVSGGGLPDGDFKLVGFHMHWGSDNNKGSEHWIDGEHYAAELHLVHKNPQYPTVADAKAAGDGLAVVGVMVKIGGDGSTFAPLMPSIENAAYPDSPDYNLVAFKLGTLLPTDRTRFVRYNGSLTTPGCNEAVIWTVMADAVEMSQDQIEKFRSELHHSSQSEVASDNSTDYFLVDNHRPPQELNGRTVYSSYKPIIPPTGATGTMATNMAVLFGALLLFVLMK